MRSSSELSKMCPNKEINKSFCNCTYEPCSRKYLCCECLRYHFRIGEVPACFFSKETERSYDRSIENFIRTRAKGF